MADTTMFTKYAEQNAMKGILNWLQSGTVTLNLIKATFTLDIDTAGANSMSVTDADFDGYNPEVVVFNPVITLDADKKAQISAPAVTFIVEGATGNSIYGWYLLNTIGPSGFIVEAKKYSTSSPNNVKDMTTSGNQLSITPTIKLFDCSIAC